MNRRLRLAALTLLLLAAGMGPAAAQDAPPVEDPAKDAPAPEPPAAPPELPKAAPRAALPAEPKDAVKKAIQALLKRWFDAEPRIPVKGKTEADSKGERAKIVGDIELEIQKAPGLLRLVAWWKSRLDETQPSDNKPTGIKAKEEFVFGEAERRKTYTFAVSVPPSYRGKGTDLLPVIITVIDKDADPKKLLPATYGKLLDTHLVVASYEQNVPNAAVMLNAIYYAYLTYRCDRDRLALDGLGKGARFVEELATAEYSALQWNGVVIRSPLATTLLEPNLGLFPVAVVEPDGTAPQAVAAAAKSHVERGGPGTFVPAGDPTKVQEFIASLPPRKAANQAGSYEFWLKSTGRMPKWGYWFLVNQAVDAGPDAPVVRVAISRDPAFNLVDIDATNLAEGTLLLNDEVLDLEQPVVVRVNGIVVAKEKVVRNFKHTLDWSTGYATLLIGPRNYWITATLPFVVEGDARIRKVDRDAAAAAEKKAEEDKAKQEELDRKAAEEEKNPKPADPVPGDAPPADAPPADAPPKEPAPAPPAPTEEGRVFTTYEEAKAAAGTRPLLVIFAAARGDDLQIALDAAMGTPEVVAMMKLKGIDRVTVKTAADGAEGEAARKLLGELSADAAAKAPYLVLVRAVGKLPIVGIAGDAALKEAILKLLEALPTPVTEKPKEPEKPVLLEWSTDYEKGRKTAGEKAVPLLLYFAADPKTKDLQAGQVKAQGMLTELLKNHKEATGLLSGMVCVQLWMGGVDQEKNAPVLTEFKANRTPPFLCWIQVTRNDKNEYATPILKTLDPVNMTGEKLTEDLVALLKQVTAPPSPAAAK